MLLTLKKVVSRRLVRPASFLAFLFCVCQAAALRSAPSPQALPATDAFSKWSEQARANAGAPDAQALATGIALAQARVKELRFLMENDPERFGRLALARANRARLPQQLQNLIE